MSFATVNFETFVNTVDPILDARFPVLLRGPHGIGKSQVVYQIAQKRGLPVVERRASQMSEGDLIGLPDNRNERIGTKKATTFNPPDWYLVACERAVVLFMDEIDRATPEVRQGFFQLTDSRCLNGHKLHEGTLIFAAVNGGECGASYQVGEMDPAELDRWTVFDLEPTIEDWLSWGKENIVDIVWDFINQNRGHLEHKGVFEPNKVYPSRRSWDRFSQTVVRAGLTKDPKASASSLYQLANAFLGFEAATAFRDFAANFERQVTVEMILNEGKINATAGFAIAEHSALVEKIEASGVFSKKLTKKQLENLARYTMSLPSEVVMKMVQGCMNTCRETASVDIEKQMATFYCGVEIDGRTVKSFVHDLLTGANSPIKEDK